MRMRLDRTVCDGFGVCARHAPEYFSLDDWGYASMTGDGVVAEADEAAVSRAILDCPVHAIIVVGETQPSRIARSAVDSRRVAEPAPVTDDSDAISEFVR